MIDASAKESGKKQQPGKNQFCPFLTELHVMFYLSGGCGGGWDDVELYRITFCVKESELCIDWK